MICSYHYIWRCEFPLVFTCSAILVSHMLLLIATTSNPVCKLAATISKQFNFSIDPKDIKINRNMSMFFHTILLNTSEEQFDSSFLYSTQSQTNLKSVITKLCFDSLHVPLIWNFSINFFKDGLEISINILKNNSCIL